MAQNKVMKLWTAIVTAFLALCTTLGLITTTAARGGSREPPGAQLHRTGSAARDSRPGPGPTPGPCPPR